MQGKAGLFDRLLYYYSFFWKTPILILSRNSYLNRSKTDYIMGLLGCGFAIKQKKSKRTLWMVVTATHCCATSVIVGSAGLGFLILATAILTGCNSRHFPPAHHWGLRGRRFESRRSDHFLGWDACFECVVTCSEGADLSEDPKNGTPRGSLAFAFIKKIHWWYGIVWVGLASWVVFRWGFEGY